jgi:hypothetical protein
MPKKDKQKYKHAELFPDFKDNGRHTYMKPREVQP